MKNKLSFMPFYFFSIIILTFAFYFLFPGWNIIPFPYNLMGMTAIIFGWHVLSKSSNIFIKNKTTFYLEKPSAFVQTGFYRKSRNPMYLGALILISGHVILMGNAIAFINPVLFFIFINYLCIPPEEIIMEKTFRGEYLLYKQSVRRWL